MENKMLNEVLNVIPIRLRYYILNLPDDIKQSLCEIRLRAEKPLILWCKGNSVIIRNDGTYSFVSSIDCVIVTREELQNTIDNVCNYSLYSHQNEIADGYITIGNGNRVGFCGEAVAEDNKIVMLKNISGLNIRIGMINPECPENILPYLRKFRGIIVAGAPCSGKTTLLKAIAELISSSFDYGLKKVTVIDERKEMQSINGVNCDKLISFNKKDGIIYAIRTLSPEVIICDEISTIDEIIQIHQGFYSGVSFVVSVHCNSVDGLLKKPVSKEIIQSGYFDYVFLLDEKNFKVEKIIKTEELMRENNLINNNYRFSL